MIHLWLLILLQLYQERLMCWICFVVPFSLNVHVFLSCVVGSCRYEQVIGGINRCDEDVGCTQQCEASGLVSVWHDANAPLCFAEAPEPEKMDTDTDSQQADKV